jgi:hypothetical protein
MASSALNYSLLSIPVYYVFSIVPHMYAGAILSSEGYKVNNANPKASLSPSAVQGKVCQVAPKILDWIRAIHSFDLYGLDTLDIRGLPPVVRTQKC